MIIFLDIYLKVPDVDLKKRAQWKSTVDVFFVS